MTQKYLIVILLIIIVGAIVYFVRSHKIAKPNYENELKVGDELPELKGANELPAGVKYSEQIIPSPYGELIYSLNQFRDGKIRWITRDNKVEIVVVSDADADINAKKILEINKK